LAQLPNLPQELRSAQVLARFGVRMIILLLFAAFGSIGFGRSLAALLWMSAILGAVLAAIRRELPFDRVLNHWDETVAYAALCCLVSGFNQAAPF
jgi:VIT1/CCC1 family predicted Fe2+/Mn2+ transporter